MTLFLSGDDVVLSPDEAERPYRLSNGTVARDVIIAHKRLLGALVIAFEPEERRGAVDCKQARFARRALLAVRCYRRNLEAGHRIADRAGAARVLEAVMVAQHHAEFGLSEMRSEEQPSELQSLMRISYA